MVCKCSEYELRVSDNGSPYQGAIIKSIHDKDGLVSWCAGMRHKECKPENIECKFGIQVQQCSCIQAEFSIIRK